MKILRQRGASSSTPAKPDASKVSEQSPVAAGPAQADSAASLDGEDMQDSGALLVDLHAASRAELLTALRTSRSSDIITIDELKTLLCHRSIGMSEAAANEVSNKLKREHGENFTSEQLVNFLIPVCAFTSKSHHGHSTPSYACIHSPPSVPSR